MQIVSLSPSSMESIKGCHNKFFIEQILKWRAGNFKAGLKGTICHKVFEILAKLKKTIDEGKNLYADEEIGITVDSTFDNSQINYLASRVFNFYKESEPHHNWKSEDEKDCVKWCRTVIESNYNPLNLNIFEIEKFFEIELIEPEFTYKYINYDKEEVMGFLKLRGIIDLIIRHDEKTYEVLDWKSGQRKDFHTQKVKELEDLYDDTQLLVYLYAIKRLYHIPNLIVTIFFIKDGGPFTLNFTEKHILRAKEKILEKFQKIKATNQIERQISWKCGTLCDFKTRTFEGTNITPFIEFRNGEFTKPGEKMSICSQVNYSLEQKGIDWTSKYLKKK